MSSSIRNQPASLEQKAHRFECDSQTKSATHYQGCDSASQNEIEKIHIQDSENVDSDDEADDYLPSIEELLRQGSRRKPSLDGIQKYKESTSPTYKSCFGPKRLNGDLGDSRDKPILVEDDVPDISPHPSATISLSVDAGIDSSNKPIKSLDLSNKEAWWDVENGSFVDADLQPFSLYERRSTDSMFVSTQGQLHPRRHSNEPSEDPMDQCDRDILSTSEDPTLPALSVLLNENIGEGKEEENISRFEKELSLAVEEQDKSLSVALGTAPSSPHSRCHFSEPLQEQIDDHNVEENTYARLLTLQDDFPTEYLHENNDTAAAHQSTVGEGEPQQQQHKANLVVLVEGIDMLGEQQQRKKKLEMIEERGELNELAMEESQQPEQQEEAQGEEEEEEDVIDDDSEDEDYSCETGDENNKDLRSTKRRRLYLAKHNIVRPYRNPSCISVSVPAAEYQEWPFKGFLKRTIIENEVTYNIEFKLPHISEHDNISALSSLLNTGLSTTHSEVRSTKSHPKRKHIPWTSKERRTIFQMKKKGCSWEEIHHALPHRTPAAIQVQYSTKIKR